jgi:hypothetical protein
MVNRREAASADAGRTLASLAGTGCRRGDDGDYELRSRRSLWSRGARRLDVEDFRGPGG